MSRRRWLGLGNKSAGQTDFDKLVHHSFIYWRGLIQAGDQGFDLRRLCDTDNRNEVAACQMIATGATRRV